MNHRPFLDIEAVRIELLRTVPMLKPGARKVYIIRRPQRNQKKKHSFSSFAPEKDIK